MNAPLAALLLAIPLLGTGCFGRFCEHDVLTSRCGLNHRGSQSRTCTDGEWSELSACHDPAPAR